MKAELTKILKNNDIESMKVYLNSGKKLDYSISINIGDDLYSIHPLFYALTIGGADNYQMAQLILKHLDLTKTPTLFNNYHAVTYAIHYFNKPNFPENILDFIYQNSTPDNKNKISLNITKYTDMSDPKEMYKIKYVLPKHQIVSILKRDNPEELLTFIQSNPDFIIQNSPQNNYLSICIENQSVFCFDIVKDYLKNKKLEHQTSHKKAHIK